MNSKQKSEEEANNRIKQMTTVEMITLIMEIQTEIKIREGAIYKIAKELDERLEKELNEQ